MVLASRVCDHLSAPRPHSANRLVSDDIIRPLCVGYPQRWRKTWTAFVHQCNEPSWEEEPHDTLRRGGQWKRLGDFSDRAEPKVSVDDKGG